VVRDKELVRNMAMKWQSDPTFTAEMALAELEVGTLSPWAYCIYGVVCCREQGTFSRIWKTSLPFPLRRDRSPQRRGPKGWEARRRDRRPQRRSTKLGRGNVSLQLAEDLHLSLICL